MKKFTRKEYDALQVKRKAAYIKRQAAKKVAKAKAAAAAGGAAKPTDDEWSAWYRTLQTQTLAAKKSDAPKNPMDQFKPLKALPTGKKACKKGTEIKGCVPDVGELCMLLKKSAKRGGDDPGSNYKRGTTLTVVSGVCGYIFEVENNQKIPAPKKDAKGKVVVVKGKDGKVVKPKIPFVRFTLYRDGATALTTTAAIAAVGAALF